MIIYDAPYDYSIVINRELYIKIMTTLRKNEKENEEVLNSLLTINARPIELYEENSFNYSKGINK